MTRVEKTGEKRVCSSVSPGESSGNEQAVSSTARQSDGSMETASGRAGNSNRVPNLSLLEVFAQVLSYPDSSYGEWVEMCAAGLREDEDAAAPFRTFAEFASAQPISSLEELFVETFEMTRKRPLEIGWHLYGEQYKRGEFLVEMRRLLREHRVPESRELPDHLSHCLALLPRMKRDEADEFTVEYLLPALKSLLEGFRDENPYEGVLQSLYRLLSRRPSQGEIARGSETP